MSALGKLVLIALVGGAAGWVGLTAGGRGVTPAMLVDQGRVQIEGWLGRDAMAMQKPQATGSYARKLVTV